MPVAKSKWTEGLPSSYFRAMQETLIAERFSGPDNTTYLATQARKDELDHQTFGRMQQAKNCLLPWLEQSVTLAGKTVLQIGCGTGSSTVPIAQATKHVVGVDISDNYIRCAQRRCDLLDIDNIDLRAVDSNWLGSEEAYHRAIGDMQPDIIICYAVIEHLLIPERIVALSAMWDTLSVGDHLVIYETPNRLHWWDWHSSKLPFFEWLPEELASVYYSRSERPGLPKTFQSDRVEELDDTKVEKMYRWGRGASFHEFDIAIGLDRIDVVADGYSPKALDRIGWLPKAPGYEAIIEDILKNYGNIHRGWSYPSLDLVLKKLS